MALDPTTAKPWIRSVVFVTALVFAFLLWRNYGWMRVPLGVDSMPELPPGTLCVVAKHPTFFARDSVVFAEFEGGQLFITRVVEVRDEFLVARHDNRNSRAGFGGPRGNLPFSAVRGLVISAFPPSR